MTRVCGRLKCTEVRTFLRTLVLLPLTTAFLAWIAFPTLFDDGAMSENQRIVQKIGKDVQKQKEAMILGRNTQILNFEKSDDCRRAQTPVAKRASAYSEEALFILFERRKISKEKTKNSIMKNLEETKLFSKNLVTILSFLRVN